MAEAQPLGGVADGARDFGRSVLDLAFYACRPRTPRGVLLRLSALFVALVAVMWGAYAFAFRDALSVFADLYLQTVQAAAHGVRPSIPASAFPANAVFAALLALVFCIVQYIALAAYESGCLRWILRGELSGVLGLDLNGDTWRVLGVYLIWLALRTVASILFAAVSLIVAAIVGGAGSPSAEMATGAWQIACDLIILYLAVRLAPAAAATIARRRFSFFEAWGVTHARFWAMVLAFLLLFVILCVVGVFTVGGALGLVYGEGAGRIIEAAQGADMETMFRLLAAPLKSPGSLGVLAFALLVNQALSMVFYVLFFGVNARAVLAAAAAGKIEGVARAPTA